MAHNQNTDINQLGEMGLEIGVRKLIDEYGPCENILVFQDSGVWNLVCKPNGELACFPLTAPVDLYPECREKEGEHHQLFFPFLILGNWEPVIGILDITHFSPQSEDNNSATSVVRVAEHYVAVKLSNTVPEGITFEVSFVEPPTNDVDA